MCLKPLLGGTSQLISEWLVSGLENTIDGLKKFRVPKILPNGGELKMVMNPMGSQSVKNRQLHKSKPTRVSMEVIVAS